MCGGQGATLQSLLCYPNLFYVFGVYSFTAIPVLIVSPDNSVVSNFVVTENGGSVEVCVQAVKTPEMLERAVTVMLSTHNGTATGRFGLTM